MTREEILNGLYDIKSWHCNGNSEMYSIIAEAIKTLEQESILDEIKSETEDTGAYEQEVNGKTEFAEGITYCLNIIDKYNTKK